MLGSSWKLKDLAKFYLQMTSHEEMRDSAYAVKLMGDSPLKHWSLVLCLGP